MAIKFNEEAHLQGHGLGHHGEDLVQDLVGEFLPVSARPQLGEPGVVLQRAADTRRYNNGLLGWKNNLKFNKNILLAIFSVIVMR